MMRMIPTKSNLKKYNRIEIKEPLPDFPEAVLFHWFYMTGNHA
jgi:hypothetical protein